MFNIDKYTHQITLTKGDNAEIEVKIKDINDADRGVFADDEVIMTIRKSANSPVVLTKQAIDGIITFNPEDTKKLPCGKYVYDVELRAFTGRIYTVIPKSYFLLEEEITQ